MQPGNRSDLSLVGQTPDAMSTDKTHDEQYVQYTHEMPYDLKESFGRFIIRIVPLLYGGMFGGLLDEIPMALTVSAVISVAVDFTMGQQSILRSLGRSLLFGGCPVIAAMAHVLAGGIRVIGLKAPAVLRNMRCGVS